MTDWPKTRKEALVARAARYFTGKPCKHGHVALRHTSHGGCEICVRERKAKRYAMDPEKGRAYHKLYRARNSEKEKQRHKIWRATNLDRARSLTRLWREKNPMRARAAVDAWQAANPEKLKTIKATQRARKLNATPVWLTDQQKLEIQHKYLLAMLHEQVTGMKWHVDHIAPLRGRKVCGLHVPWNLQVIPAKENQSKGNKFEDE